MRRPLLISISVLVVLVLIFSAAGYSLPRRSFPQVDGEIRVPGLKAPVDVYRDPDGVAHIYAANTHDLFYAEGYVHAQERFWQMDFWRHIGSGRLAEMFGESQVDTDIFLRRMGWARVAQRELDRLDAESSAILDAYAAGVNAYLEDRRGAEISLEYAVLKVTNPGYTIEPWTPLHTLTWAKAMAWDLRGNMDQEAERTVLLKTLSPEQVSQLYPPYPQDHPEIVNHPLPVSKVSTLPLAQLPVEVYPGVTDQVAVINRRAEALDLLLGPSGSGIGSNNWVISGTRTASGKPLLANDPHLGAQMPSIWYEIGLHCSPKSAGCPFDLAGFSFAGAPGIVIGHNDRIAWGFTNVGPDVQDIYIERINPYQPDQYEVNGNWVEMEVVNETIQVAGGEPVEITVRYTRHGPILWEDEQVLDDFKLKAGVELPVIYRLALRWTALEETSTFPAMWKMNKAQNWEEFRAAAAEFDVPAQNFVYADIDGNIGYQMPGRIPIRPEGVDGRTYVPGWTDDYEWLGMIPFAELPSVYNPPEGYIVTANNAVVGEGYPYLISTDWDYGYRAARIVQLIQGAPGKIDAAYMQKIQGDALTPGQDFLLPLLMRINLEDERLVGARAVFEGWDGQSGTESPQAALFAVFWKNLLLRTFTDELPEEFWPEGGSRWYRVMQTIVQKPESPWWDDRGTDERESRDEIIRQSFTAAVAELEKLQGREPSGWRWGELHTITFRNQTLGESGIAPIEALFNRGPYPVSGGESIVNATGHTITAEEPYAVDWLPSMRMIIDLSDLSQSLAVHTTGQSGHAFHPHYQDMIDLWREVRYHPMRWDAGEILSTAEGRLRLLP